MEDWNDQTKIRYEAHEVPAVALGGAQTSLFLPKTLGQALDQTKSQGIGNGLEGWSKLMVTF
jgi:hypothetical protein